jgi:hypothetical protein
MEDEANWLRFRLRRLRLTLRLLSGPNADLALAQEALAELIKDAEDRLDDISNSDSDD